MKAKEPKFVSLDKYDITGHSIFSSNKKYMLVWDLGEKNMILLKDKALSFTSQSLLVSVGDVSNTGVSIIAGTQNREDKESEVVIYAEKGERLYSKCIKARIYNLAIDQEGKIAVFQTFNSMISEDDNNKLFIIDISKNTIRASFHCPLGWADCYQFFDDKIRLHYGRKHIDYALDGECLEKKKLEESL